MNNDIYDSHCSFEVSKLLKEKGFKVLIRGVYTHYLITQKSDNPSFCMEKNEIEVSGDYIINDGPGDLSCDHYYQCSRPTHQLAMEWIRVNFGIWINIEPDIENNRCWFRIVSEKYTGDGNDKFYNSPQEATEAALLFTLQNLIP